LAQDVPSSELVGFSFLKKILFLPMQVGMVKKTFSQRKKHILLKTPRKNKKQMILPLNRI
jgi:hypothetical protein